MSAPTIMPLIASTLLLCCLTACQPTQPVSTCASSAKPIVIAHRGASGYRPEHTLAAYQLAMEQGADFIEPDLVLTKDGQLIARHENELSDTTNVAEYEQFRTRKTTKIIDGLPVTGWFSEDFTLAEIKTLRSRERIPGLRPNNKSFNDQFEVPALSEIIRLIKRYEQQTGRKIGLYPETKHPTYFQYEGRYLDGQKIHQSISKKLIGALKKDNFVDSSRIFIQSFEVANLVELQTRIMPKAGLDIPLVQLFGDLGDDETDSFGFPYDVRYHQRNNSNMNALYGALAENIRAKKTFSYADLATADALQNIKNLYAEGIGPWKSSIIPAVATDTENPRSRKKQIGSIHPLTGMAKKLDLLVHPYTFRSETPYLPLAADGTALTIEDELRQYLQLGIDGIFIDQPDIGKKMLDDACQ